MIKGKQFKKSFWVVFFSIFTAILISFLMVIAYRGKDEFSKNFCKKIKISGSYSYDGGVTFNDLYDSAVMTPTKAQSIIVEGHFDQDVDGLFPLYFYLQGLKAHIYVNGEEILCHPEITQECWQHVVNCDIKRSDDIRIELETDNQAFVNIYFLHFFNKIYNATRYVLLAELLKENVLSIIACVVIFVMGLAMIIYRICFRKTRNNDSEGLLACGIMMVIGGLTCFIDYNYITLMSSNLYLLKYLDQIFQAMIVVFVTAYMKRYMVSEESRFRSDMFVFIMMTLLSIYLVVTMILPDASKSDSMYATFMSAVVLIFTFELVELYRAERKDANNKMTAFNSVILMVLAFIVEMVYFILTGVYFIKVYMLSLLVFSILQYYLLVTTNVENFFKAQRASELENELTQNKIRMVISQIQPHFLYNAIGTIRALCTKDPKEARNALDYFAKYLRSNMDSLSEEGCVPFSKELDHVKSYLYIEKLRFGDLLDIEYDIGTTDFECPPLSLQTMVENAVKHGLLAKKEGGKLKISTKETEYCYEIKVEDNGVGFDMTKPLDDKRTHVGIVNTRQRVAGLCDGTLSVGSKIGVGTTITIAIPRERDK